MPRNRGWFRVYDRLADNPKWLQLTLAEQGLLINLWTAASAAEDSGRLPGFTRLLIRRRFAPDVDQSAIDQMVDHLLALDLLRTDDDGTFYIPRWLEHQYEFGSKMPARQRARQPGADPPVMPQASRNDSEGIQKGFGSDSEAIPQSLCSDTEAIPQGFGSDSEAIPQRFRSDLERSLEESRREKRVEGEAEEKGSGTSPEEAPPVNVSPVHRRGVRGETNALPPPSETERAVLAIWQSIDGYPFHEATDLRHLRALAHDFPTLDLLAEARRWATYKLDKPLKKGSNPRLQFRHWCQKALEFAARRRPNGTGEHARDRPDEPRAWSALREALKDPQPPPWGDLFAGLDPADKENDP